MARIMVGNGRAGVSFAEALRRASDGDVIVVGEGTHTIESVWIASLQIIGAGPDPTRTILQGQIEVRGSSRFANLTLQAPHYSNALWVKTPQARVDVEDCVVYGDPTAKYPAIVGEQATVVLQRSGVHTAQDGTGIALSDESQLYATASRLSRLSVNASRATLTDVHATLLHVTGRGRLDAGGLLDVEPPEGSRWLVLDGEATCRIERVRALSPAPEAIVQASFLQIGHAEAPAGSEHLVLTADGGLVEASDGSVVVRDRDGQSRPDTTPAPEPKAVRWRPADARRFSTAIAPQLIAGDTILIEEGEYFFDQGDGSPSVWVDFHLVGVGKAENTVVNGALRVADSARVELSNLTLRQQVEHNAILMGGESLRMSNVVVESSGDPDLPAMFARTGTTILDGCVITASPDTVTSSVQVDEHARLEASNSALGWLDLFGSSSAALVNAGAFRLWSRESAQLDGTDVLIEANTCGQRQLIAQGDARITLEAVSTDADWFEAYAVDSSTLSVSALEMPDGSSAGVYVGGDAAVDIDSERVARFDADAPTNVPDGEGDDDHDDVQDAIPADTDADDPSVPAPTPAPGDSPKGPSGRSHAVSEILAELDAIVGQETLKKQVSMLLAQIELAKKREERGLKSAVVAPHMVFTGPPGTGKTTIARVIGRLYHALGLLQSDAFVETDRQGLVSDVIGGTEENTARAIDDAMGGVLFIDEAYALANGGPNDFGTQAIDTLLKALEDRRGDFVCIVAGYPEEMQRFIASNPGLESRFTRSIAFTPYTSDELVRIAAQMADGRDDRLPEDAASVLRARLDSEELRGGFTRTSWANAREMRNIVEAAAGFRDERLSASSLDALDIDALVDLTPADITAACDQAKLGGSGSEETVEEVLAELSAQVGQDDLKKQVRSILAGVRAKQAREQHGRGVSSGLIEHMVFTGPPGTGKTTIARVLARLYRALGLLPADTVVEVDRGGLVAGYVGQTAIRTAAKIDEAMGGVLFIDEAYALASPSGGTGHDFGKEAIDTLLKRMEDDRGTFMVIAAGYSDDMEHFLESNPGLRSRFTKKIAFSSYLPEELVRIAVSMAAHAGQTLTEEARAIMRARLDAAESAGALERRDWGNARTVRNVVDEAIRLRDLRLFDTPDPTAEVTVHDLETLTAADVEAACDALGI